MALDLGHSYIDTADLYADGRCEEIVWQVAKVRRAEVEVGTKFGFIFGPTAETRGLNADPARVEVACDASLRRLGVDCIDVYYLHGVDPNFPVADTVGAMSRLVEYSLWSRDRRPTCSPSACSGIRFFGNAPLGAGS